MFHYLFIIYFYVFLFCMYCLHRKSVLLLRRRLMRKSQQNPRKRGRWVWWHLLLQRGTTFTRPRLWMFLYITILCFPEEEDNHRCLVLLGAQTRMSGRPAEPGDAVLLRQALRDRAGGAQVAGWVRASAFLNQKLSHHLIWFTSVTVCPPLPHCPDPCFLSSNDLTHTLSSYLKQGECVYQLKPPISCLFLNTPLFLFFPFFPVCPKWAKIQKQHTEKSSVVLLIVCSSALRAIELIK